MATNKTVKPTPADLSLRPLGHARDNGDASLYTGFKYPSGGGNDIGIYKQPMKSLTMMTFNTLLTLILWLPMSLLPACQHVE